MRIFQKYHFDLKDRVPFGDTLPFVEAWLAEQGIAYDGMAFAMHFNKSIKSRYVPRLLAEFPRLAKYCQEEYVYHAYSADYFGKGGFISVPENWPENLDIHVEKQDEAMLRQVAAKIPRPYKPSYTFFALDNVQWLPEINTTPAFTCGPRTPCFLGLYPHFSNSIQWRKDDEMGNSRNEITVTIERTQSSERLLGDTAILEKLAAVFQAPLYRPSLEIVFSEDEAWQIAAADFEMEPILEEIWAGLAYRFVSRREAPATPEGTQGKRVSLKKAFARAIEGTGFQYASRPGRSEYECSVINQNNHRIKIEFGKIHRTHKMEFDISISGYNFFTRIPLTEIGVTSKRESIPKQADADEVARKLVAAALEAEERLREPLLLHYGKTPDWYFKQ